MAGKPVAVTHSKGKGPAQCRQQLNNLESACNINENSKPTGGMDCNHANQGDVDNVFNSMAEIASCSYEARQVIVNHISLRPVQPISSRETSI